MLSKDYVFQMDIAVRDYELDSEGIVNNANYLHYLEMTRHEFCRQAGMPFSAMGERGIIPVLRRAEIDYIESLRSGDVMKSCLNMRREGARFVFEQDIYKADGSPVVRAKITVVTIENGRLSRGDALASCFPDYL